MSRKPTCYLTQQGYELTYHGTFHDMAHKIKSEPVNLRQQLYGC
jgi:hypothetical protein